MINKIKKGHGKIAFLQHEKAIFGSCLSPDFDLNYPDFYFHRKSGLFRTGPSPDSIPSAKEMHRLLQDLAESCRISYCTALEFESIFSLVY